MKASEEDLPQGTEPAEMQEEQEEEEKQGGGQRIRGFLEDAAEAVIFASRWILAPIYLGLIIALVVVVIYFVKELVDLVAIIGEMTSSGHDISHDLVTGVLGLLDIALIGNLLLLVIFSGYENFVSKIGAAKKHEDRPPWMGHLDFSGLKIKIVGSIVAISLIELLKAFLDIKETSGEEIFWRITLHMTFVISGLIFAIMDYWGEKRVGTELQNLKFEEDNGGKEAFEDKL
ncbi:MAG: TIGR00645 family protein [Actinomycetia bacterium]|nr:TIGR00645 family protein [Actinomycetes bacterium]